MTDKIALSTVAQFAGLLTEMLETMPDTDRPELLKRYGATLTRLRTVLDKWHRPTNP